MRDGFDVHHIDGDHSNNSPENLVLLEHWDHMRFHGAPLGGLRFGSIEWSKCRKVADIDPDMEMGAKAFLAKFSGNVPYKKTADEFGISSHLMTKMVRRYEKSERRHQDEYQRKKRALFGS